MRTTEVLQKCLGESLHAIHALRSRVLLRAVEATISGCRLTLLDLARAWPDAQRVRAPLKALDRLLGNRHLHTERERIHAAMVRWLVCSDQPVIIMGWSDLKVVRAAIPVGGRILTVPDMVFPAGKQGLPKAEKQFFCAASRRCCLNMYSAGITQAQADSLFSADMQPFVDEVNTDLTVGVAQNQFDALVILCYNIGQSAFASSSTLKLVNNPAAATAYKTLDDAWKAFNKSQGVQNSGLNNRRAAELKIYNNSDYSGW